VVVLLSRLAIRTPFFSPFVTCSFLPARTQQWLALDDSGYVSSGLSASLLAVHVLSALRIILLAALLVCVNFLLFIKKY
jgi:hypothetical protein